MKKRRKALLILSLLAALLLCSLPGCGALPQLFPAQAGTDVPAALELHLSDAQPEDIVLTWDPSAVTVDSAEVSVSEGGPGLPRTVTVTIQLRSGQSGS